MQYHEFIGHVQHRARLGSLGDAVRAANATLQTLAERLPSEEAEHLAAQLPYEIGRFIREHATGFERFSVDEFFNRVTDREGIDKPEAVFHARAVLEVLREAVSAGQIEQIRNQLPGEFTTLFDSGSEGQLRFH
jgi:uncharacterized protein (DUF2267 family)